MSLIYTDTTGSIEFDKLSKHKENIQPVNSGRTVSQLTQIVDLATNKPVLSSLLTPCKFHMLILRFKAQNQTQCRFQLTCRFPLEQRSAGFLAEIYVINLWYSVIFSTITPN